MLTNAQKKEVLKTVYQWMVTTYLKDRWDCDAQLTWLDWWNVRRQIRADEGLDPQLYYRRDMHHHDGCMAWDLTTYADTTASLVVPHITLINQYEGKTGQEAGDEWYAEFLRLKAGRRHTAEHRRAERLAAMTPQERAFEAWLEKL